MRSKRAKAIWMGSALIVGCGIVLISSRFMQQQAPEITGNLSKRDVAEIRQAVWRKTHPSILPDWSRPALAQGPKLLVMRIRASKERIFRIEGRNEQFAAVLGRSAADAKAHKYVFWCVFKGAKGWVAEQEYRLTEKGAEP